MTELYHYGILGMKWGVRRYQNYDGSYTKAGLKRYNQSYENYENANNTYKTFKKVNNKTVDIKTDSGYQSVNLNLSKNEMKSLKNDKQNAKKQLQADYKHLKQDKLGDQGKQKYSEGKRIRENQKVNATMHATAGIIALGSYFAKEYDLINTKQFMAGVGAAATVEAAAVVKSVADERVNNQLRAYYSHTYKY